jgi:hypothetical protein
VFHAEYTRSEFPQTRFQPSDLFNRPSSVWLSVT